MSAAIQVKEVQSEKAKAVIQQAAPALSLAGQPSNAESLKSATERLRAINLERNLKSLQYILNSLSNAEMRFYPHFDEATGEVKWRKLFMENWTCDERLALQWLQTIWTGKMCVKPHKYGSLLPSDYELKEAVLCAFTSGCYVSYIIDNHYRDKHSRKRPVESVERSEELSARQHEA